MQQNAVIPLSFNGHALNCVLDDAGNPLFRASDLCEILEFENPRTALQNHVDPEDVLKQDTLTAGGIQAVSHVNESGMYSLIFGSKKPAAKSFKRWVTSEVLPAIRKTGTYVAPSTQMQHAVEALFSEHLEALADALVPKLRVMDFSVHVTHPVSGLSSTISVGDLVNTQLNMAERLKSCVDAVQEVGSELERQREFLNDLRLAINNQADMLKFAFQQVFGTENYREAVRDAEFQAYSHKEKLENAIQRVNKLESASIRVHARLKVLEHDSAS